MSEKMPTHPDPMETTYGPLYAPQQAASSFAAPTGLAARVVVNQALVDEIIRRAQDSNFGLSEREASVDITHYAQPNMDALAMLLVGAWSAKYDIVSVFSAAMSVIQEKAANVEPCDGGTKKL